MNADKDKQTLDAYGIRGKGKSSSTSENKEKARDGCVFIYECGKHLLYSMYEGTCVSKEANTSRMKGILEAFNYEIKEICSTNRDMRTYNGSVNK